MVQKFDNKDWLPRETVALTSARNGFNIYANTRTDNSPFQIVNAGIITESTRLSPFVHVSTGIGKVNWSMEMWHNLRLNDGLAWVQDNPNFPSSMIEQGAEGVTIHVIAKNTNFGNTPHEVWQAKGEGPDGTELPHNFNQIIQSKITNYFKYRSGAYTGDGHPWNYGYGQNPGTYYHSEEAKSHGWVWTEQNSASAETPAFSWFKSGGTYLAQTAALAGHSGMNLETWLHDGTQYQLVVRARAQATANADTGNAPSAYFIETGNSTANRSTHMGFFSEGHIFVREAAAFPAGNPVNGIWLRIDPTSGEIHTKNEAGVIKTLAYTGAV